MSVTSDRLLLGFAKMVKRAGTPISVRYYTQSTGSIYDEPDTLAQSGATLWTSGIVFTVDPNSSSDNVLLEQGKIGLNDLRLYVAGSLAFSLNTGSVIQTKLGLGSPGIDFYSLIPLGGDAEEVSGVKVYKKAYFRRLTNGSLIGEV